MAINETNNELPINIVSESNLKQEKLLNEYGSLSLILIGDSNVGKNDFLTHILKKKIINYFYLL